MPITGVMPEPAVTNRSLPPSVGSTKSPAACSSWTSVPGLGVPDEVVADLAVGNGLDGDADPAVGARAVGQRVGPPLPYAVHVDADPDVLPGDVAGPVGAGPDLERGGVGGLGQHGHDPAAQLGAAPERVEQVEVVGGQQRRGDTFGQPEQALTATSVG